MMEGDIAKQRREGMLHCIFYVYGGYKGTRCTRNGEHTRISGSTGKHIRCSRSGSLRWVYKVTKRCGKEPREGCELIPTGTSGVE